MIETAISESSRGLGPSRCCSWLAPRPLRPSTPRLRFPAPRNQTCLRLESQLAGIDRGTVDPARAEQIKRYEEVIGQAAGRTRPPRSTGQRMGCSGRRLLRPVQRPAGAVRSAQQPDPADQGEPRPPHGRSPARCRATAPTAKANAARSWSRSARTIAVRSTGNMRPRRGASSRPCSESARPSGPPRTLRCGSGTYRTVCVRTCDGYYFPISYSTVPTKFSEDERLCQRLCPATEVALYSHRNPGEDVTQAVSSSGQVLFRAAERLQLSQAVQPGLQLPGARASPGRRRCGNSTTTPSSAAISSSPRSRRRLCRSRAPTRRASRSSSRPIRPAPGARTAAGAPKSAAAAPRPPAAGGAPAAGRTARGRPGEAQSASGRAGLLSDPVIRTRHVDCRDLPRAALAGMAALAAGRLVRRPAGRRGRSRWSTGWRPADRATSLRASSPRAWRGASASRSWSTHGPAPEAGSRPGRSPAPRPMAIR